MAASRTRSSSAELRLRPRHVQQALGVIWILDGLLQLQPYMFSHAFLAQMISSMASSQPGPIAWSITTMVHVLAPIHVLANALFAATQVAIGIGLLVSRRTVRPALLLSFGWAFIVWWFGEGFGMLAMGMASPLTGAPGAVVLYVLIGVLVWPTDRQEGPSVAASGPLGDRGGRSVWAAVWLLSGLLMLLPANMSADGLQNTFVAASDASSGPLKAVNSALASAVGDHGTAIALILALIMGIVGVAVLADWDRNLFIGLGALIAIAIWLTAEYLGGMLTGSGTDPNTGPLLVLLGLTVYRQAASQVPSGWAALSPQTRRRMMTLGLPAVVLAAFLAGGVFVIAGQHHAQSEPINFEQTVATPDYSVLLLVAPPQTMWTPKQVKQLHPTDGEVMFSGQMVMPPGMSQGMDMTGANGWYHMEVHIYSRSSGAVVTNVNPVILVTNDNTHQTSTLPIVTMQGVTEGRPDFHYGNNVQLPAHDHFSVRVQVGTDVAVFHFTMG